MPIPISLPAIAPTAMLGINRPDGTYDKEAQRKHRLGLGDVMMQCQYCEELRQDTVSVFSNV